MLSEARVQPTRDLTQALYVAAVALGRTRDAEEVVRAAITETQRATGVEASEKKEKPATPTPPEDY
jgi:hypothetical protein